MQCLANCLLQAAIRSVEVHFLSGTDLQQKLVEKEADSHEVYLMLMFTNQWEQPLHLFPSGGPAVVPRPG